jgi:cytochrome P450
MLGSHRQDTFPILKHIPRWLPGAGFKRQAEEWLKLSSGMREIPFAETKRQVVRHLKFRLPSHPKQRKQKAGTARASFAADSLQALKDSENELYYQERHVKAAAGTMFIGGADTTVSALSTFVLAMLANPEAQKKAQEEIDSMTSGKYLPTFNDEASMPYVSALVKEVMRWENVTPAGKSGVQTSFTFSLLPAVPHLLMSDDEYRGYRLPAGSIVIGNAW